MNMDFDSNMDSSGDDNILDELRKEHEKLQMRIRENQSLIDQSTAEVQRWEEETGRITSQLSRVHDNFDTLPRSDIRETYDALLEAQRRLLPQRAQLEQLEKNQEMMKVYSYLFERLLESLQGQHLGGGRSGGASASTTTTSMTPAGETLVRIVQTQEDERQELAKKLHDGPAQSLTNFILQAEVCQRLFDRDPDRATNELANLKTAASASFQKVRDFIFDLRPMMLDDLGLIPTLRRYTENFEQKSEIDIDFNFTGEEHRRVAHHTEVMMFRTIQSLLGISRDYLAATKIKIQVDLALTAITARMEDNGQGFDPEVALDPSQGESNVQILNGLRDRLELVGGDMDIYSEEGGGSRFHITLPIFEDEYEPSF